MTEDYKEYITALELVDKVKSADDVDKAWDEMFTFLFANFPVPETATMTDKSMIRDHVECHECTFMLSQNRDQIAENLRSIPPVIPAVIFPAWCARYLLYCTTVAVNPLNLSTFDEFMNRYHNQIFLCR